MDKYLFYDSIVSATYTNLAIEAIKNKGIYFNNFKKDEYIDKFFLKIAFMVADFEDQKIYLHCKFFDFLKILFNNYNIKKIISRKCCLRYHWYQQIPCTDIEELARFEAKEFDVGLWIFKEIWNAYYEDERKDN